MNYCQNEAAAAVVSFPILKLQHNDWATGLKNCLRRAQVCVQSAVALFKGPRNFQTLKAAIAMRYRCFLSVMFLLLSKVKLENYTNFWNIPRFIFLLKIIFPPVFLKFKSGTANHSTTEEWFYYFSGEDYGVFYISALLLK